MDENVQSPVSQTSQERLAPNKTRARKFGEYVLGLLLLPAVSLLVIAVLSFLPRDLYNLALMPALLVVAIALPAYARKKSRDLYWGMLTAILLPLLIMGSCAIFLTTILH